MGGDVVFARGYGRADGKVTRGADWMASNRISKRSGVGQKQMEGLGWTSSSSSSKKQGKFE